MIYAQVHFSVPLFDRVAGCTGFLPFSFIDTPARCSLTCFRAFRRNTTEILKIDKARWYGLGLISILKMNNIADLL
jgi:hypothetical protein